MVTYLIQDPEQSYLPFMFFVFSDCPPVMSTLDDVRAQVANDLKVIGLIRTLEPSEEWATIVSINGELTRIKGCNCWQGAIISVRNQAKAEGLYSRQIDSSLTAWGRWLEITFGSQIPTDKTDSVLPLLDILGGETDPAQNDQDTRVKSS